MEKIYYTVEFKILNINCKGEAYYDKENNKEIYKTGVQRIKEIWKEESHNTPFKVSATIFESDTIYPSSPEKDNHGVTIMGTSNSMTLGDIQMYKFSVQQIAAVIKGRTQCGDIKITFNYIDEIKYI